MRAWCLASSWARVLAVGWWSTGAALLDYKALPANGVTTSWMNPEDHVIVENRGALKMLFQDPRLKGIISRKLEIRNPLRISWRWPSLKWTLLHRRQCFAL